MSNLQLVKREILEEMYKRLQRERDALLLEVARLAKENKSLKNRCKSSP